MVPVTHLSSPLVVNWGLTARCNFVCSHCFSRLDKSTELTTEVAERVAGKLSSAGVMYVNFGTGEPLLRSDIYHLASHCLSLGMKVSMNSNGSLIGKREAERIKEAGFERVGISIDSASPEIHDSFRKHPGSYEKAVGAARFLVASGVPISISSVICRINHKDFKELVALAKRLGAGVIDLHNFKCSGMGGLNKEELDLSPAEWGDFYQQALPLKEKDPGIEILFDDPVISLLRHDDGKVVDGSVCGKVSLYIAPDGSITPCGFIPLTIGNILTDDLMELWEGAPLLAKLRNKEARGKCSSCQAFNRCLGGCSARAYSTGGSFETPDPHCWYEEKSPCR